VSVGYNPVGWDRSKIVYDLLLAATISAYLLAYQWLAPVLQPLQPQPDAPTLGMKAYGSCAFLLLTAVLCIGPLARLDSRLLPLLYNRRHFGVATWAVAAGHAVQVLGWYFAYSHYSQIEALLTADTSFGQLHGFPFIPFGVAAFLLLSVLAFTSHDFWLHFLRPPVWKALHMGIYGAYALAVLHVAMGALQASENATLAAVVGASVALVCGLHVAAALRGRTDEAKAAPEPPWLDVAALDDIRDGYGIVAHPADGETVAIFRDGARIAAVSNLCAHQNGPLGEGRVIDGCITCPWHGFQYRLEDGCAPPPFTEKLATYAVRIVGPRVWLDPRPHPPGTKLAPAMVRP
jgi:nitrite reductase/ring-hydroxylating ferredoxin subunit/DMSO/TMAO reductase YedYZ heme-binding membrane subunit